jgi:zinc/manganese transport system permease protein
MGPGSSLRSARDDGVFELNAMLHDLLIGPFAEFDFMRRALVGVIALSVSGAPVGVFLMLRRMSLTGDAMAHAILPGAALGYLVAGFSLPAMTLGGLAAGFTVALAAGAVARLTVLKEDASLAAFYLISLALGVTLVSLRGSAVDLFHVLFGNVLALDDDVLVLLSGVASLTLGVLALVYRPLVLECVDPGFLRSVSRSGGVVHLTFLGLVVLNLVAGFHALGTLLAVGLMMLPAAAARFWTADVTRLILLASGFGMASGYIGLVASYAAGSNLPAGPAIILAAGALYLGSLLLGSQGGLARRLLPRAHLQR